MEVKLHAFLTLVLNATEMHLQIPATSLLGKKRVVPMGLEAGWRQSECGGEMNKFYLLSQIRAHRLSPLY
jgi:hypothetical protein